MENLNVSDAVVVSRSALRGMTDKARMALRLSKQGVAMTKADRLELAKAVKAVKASVAPHTLKPSKYLPKPTKG